MLSYLNAIGRRIDAVEIPGTSRRAVEAALLYVYDLSDPDRLGAATAEDFTVPGGVINVPAGPFSCYGVLKPDGEVK